jgi:argininosuccinate lyase
MQATLASKASFGGTAPSRVAKAIHEASERLEASSEKEPEDD